MHRHAAGGVRLRFRLRIGLPGSRRILPAYEGLVVAAGIVYKAFEAAGDGRKGADDIGYLYELAGEGIIQALECIQAAHVGIAGHSMAHAVGPQGVRVLKYILYTTVARPAVEVVAALHQEIVWVVQPVVYGVNACIQAADGRVQAEGRIAIGRIIACVIAIVDLVCAAGMGNGSRSGTGAAGQHAALGAGCVCRDGNIPAQRRSLHI